MMQAKPTKLRNGTWGARVEGAASVGDEIQITAANGKSWTARVKRVLWTSDDGDVSIVATSSKDRPARSQRRGRRARRGDGGPRGSEPCYMCGSYYCEGARGGLCEDD